MTKDTDRTPRPPAAPPERPASEDRAAGTGSPYFSDDTPPRPPRTTPSTPPATVPVPLAEKDTGRGTDTGRTGTGLTAPGAESRDTDTGSGSGTGTGTGTGTFGTTTSRHEPDRDSRTHSTPPKDECLLPTGDQDKLAHRLHQAVTDFVESPQRAVEEAESTFDAVVAGLTDALKERRSTLHVDERDGDDPGARTEELRITLQHYRDLTERLLKI
ncbi:hypothetical protein ACFWNC_32995 [Streptomyces sp. NPDC058369]|uniref:hypothetical protein n=1 Tax=Streptomyces sp. NPDC058369 TaxID=3346462 RepID=UPI003663951A